MKHGKHLIFASLMLLLTAVLIGCTHTPSDTLTVDFYKIGKADAIYLRGTDDDGRRFSVLIDTGESDDAAEISEKIRQSGTQTLDYLILTHYDKDHIGGLVPLLSVLSAETILMPDYVGEGEPYEAMVSLFADGTYNTQVLSEDLSFTLGGTVFSVSVPKRAEYEKKQDNNSSLVITVTHGKNTLVFAGDAEAERQAELISGLTDAAVPGTTLLKVPHHGVWNRGLDTFFAAYRPAYAVITCSDKNPAEEETLRALEALGTAVFLTADGDIHVTCTENDITVTQ